MSNSSAGKSAAKVPVVDAKPLRYVARQPILDREERVFGYELLFRDGLENAFSGNPDVASRETLDRSLMAGLDVLCDGRRAFVNCTRDTLIKGLVTLLPSTSTVVEVLEMVPADPDVVAACRSLKEAGYMIALDDYVANDPREALADLADIIKVEMQLTTGGATDGIDQAVRAVALPYAGGKNRNSGGVRTGAGSGICVFSGILLSPSGNDYDARPAGEPDELSADVAGSVAAGTGFGRTGETGQGEASVCYRLLRYLNSAIFGFQTEIHSVRHALSILGERGVRRWVRLVAAVGAGQGKPSDLVLSSLVRGRFGELLAPRVPHGESDLFLLGLLSLIDAMLEMPMEVVLEKIPLDHATKAVLLGQPSELRSVFQLMQAHESGDWDAVRKLNTTLHLDSEEVAGDYWQAQQWAREISNGK